MVVCDGFAGNILLKTLESSFELLYELIRREIEHECSGVCELVAPIVKRAFGLGGAVLLGVKGNVIICHGNSKAEIIEKVLLNCADCFSQKK